MPKVVMVVQARLGSTRLPGKVLLPILGKPMLALQLERLARCEMVDELVLAIPEGQGEQPLADLAASLNIRLIRGPEDDVLERYYLAATEAEASTVVRVTSDCPLIDPVIVDQIIHAFNSGIFDYASNCQNRTFPRGLDTEVFSYAALTAAHMEADNLSDREHVTPFIWRKPARFRLFDFVQQSDHSGKRWTVDTPEDLNFVTQVYHRLYPDNPEFGLSEILSLLSSEPALEAINANITQKPILP